MKTTSRFLVFMIVSAVLTMAFGCVKKSNENKILLFKFTDPDVEATIGDDMKIEAIVPFGTDVTALVPVITISEKATINPASGEPMDFTNPVPFTVTAEDGSKAVYTVTVLVDPGSNEKEILSFRLENPDVEAVIDEELKTVTVLLPYGTDVTALVPDIIISDKATIEPASGVATDFTHLVTYTVTAENGSQTNYLVLIEIEAPETLLYGIWGVERLEYYETDFAGNPDPSTMQIFSFVPGDQDNGIDLIFRENKTGEIVDRSRDTLYVWHDGHNNTIICPDTTIVKRFYYCFEIGISKLYMNLESVIHHFDIVELTSDSFVYEDEYAPHYVEKAFMKRISDMPNKVNSSGKKKKVSPNKLGSLLGDY
ncbi:MAG: DUF5018 domain-containing protein [Bacteroidales bacterium]|nr:DUF5018 domain-containing protein [Bacteroidales bacterium]